MGLGNVKDFFHEWEIGICVLLSLLLQILLILAAPLRRIVSHKGLHILLWLAYLLADGIAIFAVGLIARKQTEYFNHCLTAPTNSILHTFWAPLLLAHLGGPDPITSLALEDNELWLRHLFYLFTQCIAVAYIFYQSLTHNKLLVPSLLMFLCGIIKYAERTYALYCASTNTFRDYILNEPGGKWREMAEIGGNWREFIVVPDRSEEDNATDLKPLEVVQYGFLCFSKFKGLVVDLIFTFKDQDLSRDFFMRVKSSNDAFRVVEVELNFLYDVLFTKLPVVYYRVGFGCRAASVVAIVTSLVLFHYVDKEHLKLEGFEVGITYILLIGGIVLEAIALFTLFFSDWAVMKLNHLPSKNGHEQIWKRTLMDFIVSANVRRGKIICWLLNIGGVRGSGSDSLSEPTDCRWAESVSGFNFTYYCLHRRSRGKDKILDQFGIRAFLDELVYVKQHPLPSYVKDFIFKELKRKSGSVSNKNTAKRAFSARGEWVLESEGCRNFNLLRFVADYEYDESLLLWHIATELCYNYEEDENIHLCQHDRKTAKLISEYMIYLLVMKPGMMSAVSKKVLMIFSQTCDEAEDIFDLTKDTAVKSQGEANERFYNKLWEEYDDMSMLGVAAKLARHLKEIEFKKRWEITSKVWAELLSYGAGHIKSNAHAQQLSKGGEFITIVWLLMSHLGFADQFEGLRFAYIRATRTRPRRSRRVT